MGQLVYIETMMFIILARREVLSAMGELLCVPEKAGLTNGLPSYKLCFEEGCFIQII